MAQQVQIVQADQEFPDDPDKAKSLGWFDVDEGSESTISLSDFYGGTTKILGPNTTMVILRTTGLTPGEAPEEPTPAADPNSDPGSQDAASATKAADSSTAEKTTTKK